MARGQVHFPAGLDWMPHTQGGQGTSALLKFTGSAVHRGVRVGARNSAPLGSRNLGEKVSVIQTSRILTCKTGAIIAPGHLCWSLGQP